MKKVNLKESKEKHQYNISTVEEEAERWYYIKRNWKTNLASSNWGLDKNSGSWWLGFQVEDALLNFRSKSTVFIIYNIKFIHLVFFF